MAFINKVQRWISEPPPEHVFEITEHSLARISTRTGGQPKLETLGERSLVASPSAPNLVRPQVYRDALLKFNGSQAQRRRTVALVIPDYAVRMAILDFEEFPATEEQRIALLRFRLRKSVPFHIDEAQVAYSIQLNEPRRIEVLAVAIAQPILLEYEGLFSDGGFRVGLVTPSCIAALPLYATAGSGLTLVAKMAGSTISMLLAEAGRVRLVRCLDLAAGDGEITQQRTEGALTLLQQTLAYAEDQIGAQATRLLLCGFGEETDALGRLAEQELRIGYTAVRSRYGTASQETAGLLGLMEQYAA
jgi:type IV pilus assembly protein PilM